MEAAEKKKKEATALKGKEETHLTVAEGEEEEEGRSQRHDRMK